jgi:hypothetical protein
MTLLISPGQFDLHQPVKVIANGREVFNARVNPSLKTLLKWAARDNGRSMLYAAEIKITLSR